MIQKRATFYVALLSKNNLLAMQEHSYTVQVELCTVPELLHRLINDCSMFCAVLVAFEVLPHMTCWRRMMTRRTCGTGMQRTRVRASSPDFIGLGTCSIVPRLFWNGYESRPETNIRERIEYYLANEYPNIRYIRLVVVILQRNIWGWCTTL